MESISRRDALKSIAGTGVAVAGLTTAVSGQEEQTPPAERWSYQTEGGQDVYSSPTVVDGTVYVGSSDYNLYALDAKTGDRLWQYKETSDISSSPAVADGVVIGAHEWFPEQVFALDAETGEKHWQFEPEGTVLSSPTIFDGTVFVGSHAVESSTETDDDDSGYVYSINITTGEKEWQTETAAGVRSSPLVIDGTLFVGDQAGKMYAFDTDSGQEQWRYATAEPEGDAIVSAPTAVDGTVYVGTLSNSLYAFDAETGDVQWEFTADDGIWSSPTHFHETIFVGSWDSSVYALDAQTGDKQWEFTTGDSVLSSPTVAGDTVFVGSDDYNVYALNRETGESRWTFATGSSVHSSPIVVDGTLYVGSMDGNVYAIETGEDGSSEDSRVRQGTLGHHHTWADSVRPFSEPQSAESDTSSEFDGLLLPGTVAGSIGLGTIGWSLKRWLNDDD